LPLILREKTGTIKNLSVTDNAGKDKIVTNGADLLTLNLHSLRQAYKVVQEAAF